MSLPRGLFITFEGPEGSGKSTQIRMLAERLRVSGRDLVQTVEPGGTPIGMQIRRVFLDAKNREMCPTTELLLTFASRAQNVDECILPALAKGQIVLSDRFTDSTLVYQGIGRGLGAEVVYEVDRIACRGLVPDLTLLIDVDTDVGLERARQRNQRTKDIETRIDEHASAFHHKIREAYHQLAADEPRRVKLIDGGRDPENVAREVWRVVEAYLK
jgi:dTMP kinase